MQRLILTREHWNRMRSHVESTRPREACGLLAGKGELVSDVLQISNQNGSETTFRMDPVEQIRAFNWMEANGLELIGIYHSHPAGPETGVPGNSGPSATDVFEAAYPVAYVIWSRPEGTWQARCFSIEDGRALEVELRVESGS